MLKRSGTNNEALFRFCSALSFRHIISNPAFPSMRSDREENRKLPPLRISLSRPFPESCNENNKPGPGLALLLQPHLRILRESFLLPFGGADVELSPCVHINQHRCLSVSRVILRDLPELRPWLSVEDAENVALNKYITTLNTLWTIVDLRPLPLFALMRVRHRYCLPSQSSEKWQPSFLVKRPPHDPPRDSQYSPASR